MINLDDRFVTEIMPLVGAKATAVLLAISKHCGPDRSAFPSVKTLMFLTGMGRDAVREAINKLVLNSLISKHQRRKGNRQSSNLYRLKSPYLTVYIKASMQLEEFQPTESQATESQTPENPTLSINHSIEVLTNKEEKSKKQETCYSFDQFWEDYGYKKGKIEARQYWPKVKEEDRLHIKATVSLYTKETHTPTQAKTAKDWKDGRKWPIRYLKKQTYLDYDKPEETVYTNQQKKDYDQYMRWLVENHPGILKQKLNLSMADHCRFVAAKFDGLRDQDRGYILRSTHAKYPAKLAERPGLVFMDFIEEFVSEHIERCNV